MLSFLRALAETLVQEPKQFDIVCSMEVIEHVDNPAAFLRSCAELVKPGGRLFLSSQRSRRRRSHTFLAIVAAEKAFRIVEPGTYTFSKFINSDELVGVFAEPLAPDSRPWISRTDAHGLLTRVDAAVRGMCLSHLPWRWDWAFAPRATTRWSTVELFVLGTEA